MDGGRGKICGVRVKWQTFFSPRSCQRNEAALLSHTVPPTPPLRLSIPAATVSQVKSRGFLPRICKLYKSVRVEAQAAASYSYIASSSFAFLVFGGIFEMLLAAFLATSALPKIFQENIFFFFSGVYCILCGEAR